MKCSYPQVHRNKSDWSTYVHACGRCRACRRNKQREWSFRVFAESLDYEHTVFLRLSYDDEHLPISSNGYPTLVKEHLQDFIKRLRYYVGKCRYYACGEYGERTHRPHYHVILYGVSPDDAVFIAKYCYNGLVTANCKAWPHGEITIGDVTIKSCNYCCKYMLKRKNGKLAKLYFDKYGELPEFGLMSRNPGIGYNYLKRNENLIKQRGYLMLKGHKVPIPRYYILKMYVDGSDEYEEFKLDRKKKTDENFKKFFASRSIGDFSERAYLRAYLEQQEVNLMKGEDN